jgi:LysR family transcriptional regulator, nitrogen assimilation regulatory protein
MNLKQLEYFVRVAELSSFSRAALQLGLPQPALSRHVRQLELELRQTLLLRNGRGATPTEAGKLLLSHARGILHQVALASESMDHSRGQLAGRVAIGLPPSLSRRITVPLAQAFRSELPLAQLSLTEGFSVQMYENLRLGNLDLTLLYNPELTPELEHTVVHQEALVLISKADKNTSKQSVTLDELAKLPLVLPSRPNAFRILLENAMMQRKLKPKIVLEVDGLNSILSLVQEGMGHAVLPSYTLETTQKSLMTRAIVEPELMSKLTLVKSALRPSTHTQSAAAQLLTRLVKASL